MMETCDARKLHVERMDNHKANAVVRREHYLRRGVYIARTVSYRVTYDGLPGLGVLMFGYPVFSMRRGLLAGRTPARRCVGTDGGCRKLIAGERQGMRRRACSSCGTRTRWGHADDNFTCSGCAHGWRETPGPLRAGELVELQRVWLPDRFPRNSESCAIAAALAALRADWAAAAGVTPRCVVSLADELVGHEGRIYRAAGFREFARIRGYVAAVGRGQGRWWTAPDHKTRERGWKTMFVRVLPGPGRHRLERELLGR